MLTVSSLVRRRVPPLALWAPRVVVTTLLPWVIIVFMGILFSVVVCVVLLSVVFTSLQLATLPFPSLVFGLVLVYRLGHVVLFWA